jgi:hypothetical protein
MKPYAGGGWKHVYKINDMNELFAKHAETGQLVMLLQKKLSSMLISAAIALAENMFV